MAKLVREEVTLHGKSAVKANRDLSEGSGRRPLRQFNSLFPSYARRLKV